MTQHPFMTIGALASASGATVATFIGTGNLPPDGITGLVDTSFAKGAALSEWLTVVNAASAPGQLLIRQGQHSISNVGAGSFQFLNNVIQRLQSLSPHQSTRQ